MKLDELIADVHVVGTTGDVHVEISSIVVDSRHVKPGVMFAAVRGHRLDGNRFIPEAVDRGAVAVLLEDGHDVHAEQTDQSRPVCFVRVRDVRRSLATIADRLNKMPSREMLMIGITGTNGKTTTSYIVSQVLMAAGLAPGVITTVAYEFGSRSIPAERTTPDAPTLQNMLAQMLEAGCKSVVMEVSSHALSQSRVEAVDYDIGVFTNLTHDHLDYHGGMEAYFEAKTLLFEGLGSIGQSHRAAGAVINIDDPWGRRLANGAAIKVDKITYGIDEEADVRARDVKLTGKGSAFTVVSPWGSVNIGSPLLGRFNVSNVLAAIATCGCAGIDLKCISKSVADMQPVRGRLELVKIARNVQVFVDYAHTDDALQNVLGTLREITNGRLLLVFGCGGDRDKAKRAKMGRVASRMADWTVVTSDNPRSEDPCTIMEEIRLGFDENSNVTLVEDRRKAIRHALESAQSGDTILIAGKGHESFQEFRNTTMSFDDRQVTKEEAARI